MPGGYKDQHDMSKLGFEKLAFDTELEDDVLLGCVDEIRGRAFS